MGAVASALSRQTDHERLCKAARRGDAVACAAILAAARTAARRATLLARADSKGSMPLHCASSQGFEEVVGFLLEQGADVHALDANGETSLHHAASAPRAAQACCRRLLDAGANVHARDHRGTSPLHCAAVRRGAVSVCQLLLARGADPNSRSLSGRTPLIAAAEFDHTAPLAAVLLQAGADVHARANDSSSLSQAVMLGNGRVASVLLAGGADPNDTVAALPLLLLAAGCAAVGLCAALLQHGANPNATALLSGGSALYVAAENDRPGAVRDLLAAGADPNIPAGDGRYRETPLHVAARLNNVSALLALLRLPVPAVPRRAFDAETEAAIAAVTSHVRAHGASTPASPAATGTSTSVCTPVLVDVNALDAEGLSPLLLAAAAGHEEAVSALLDGGASVSAQNTQGLTALHLAVQHASNVVSAPESQPSTGIQLVRLADGSIRMVKGVGAASEEPSDKRAARHAAALRVCAALLDAGADINARSQAGVTCLAVAAARGSCTLAKWLLAHGARVFTTPPGSEVEHTPLSAVYAALASSMGSIAQRAEPEAIQELVGRLRRAAQQELRLMSGPDSAGTGTGSDLEPAYCGVHIPGSMRAPGGWHTSAVHRWPLLVAADASALAEVASDNGSATGPASSAINTGGWAPLHVAAARGDVTACLAAIDTVGTDSGARSRNVNVRTKGGATALLLAAVCGHTAVVTALLSRGASLRAANHLGITPLHAAAQRGSNACVLALLQAPLAVGASGSSSPEDTFSNPLASTMQVVDVVDGSSMSPTHHAVAFGHVEVFRTLVAAGARLWHESNTSILVPNRRAALATRGRSILDAPVALVKLAARAGHTALARELIDLTGARAGSDAALLACMQACVSAASCGALETAMQLLELSASMPRPPPGREQMVYPTAVQFADNLLFVATQGRADIVSALLAKGASHTPRDAPREWFPVHVAACVGNVEALKVLLAAGASPTGPRTPGSSASIGCTPLEIAASCGHTATVRLLLAALATSSAGGSLSDVFPGQPPVPTATSSGVSTRLTDRNVGVGTSVHVDVGACPLFRAARAGAADAFTLLYAALPSAAQDTSLLARDGIGMSLMNWAAKAGSAQLVRTLAL